MSGKGSAPEPPDPYETAAAQTGTNISTATGNAFLGNVNQTTPYGSLTYNQTGVQSVTNPETGDTYEVPTFEAVTELSDAGQQMLDLNNETGINLGQVAADQSAFLIDYMNEPVDLSSDNVRQYMNDHFMDNFDRQWDQQRTDLETRLAEQGIGVGNAAYTRAMRDYTDSRQGAQDDMYGNMYSLAQNSLLAERNQPINEIIGLLNGSQVQNPSFANTNSPQMPTVDLAGLINQDYQNQLSQYQMQQQAAGGLFSALGDIGSAAIMMSDRRAKTDIERIGTFGKLPVYTFKYKGQDDVHTGFMADEVEAIAPEAILVNADGYKLVNYSIAMEAAL